MRLYLLRHAQSVNNAIYLNDPDNFQSRRQHDPGLTDIGFQQAEYAAQHLAEAIDSVQEQEPFGITHVYCSPMQRTLLTAQPIAEKLNVVPEVWRDIHEIGGMFELDTEGQVVGYTGMTRQQIVDRFGYTVPETSVTENGWWKPEQGSEEVADFLSRAVRVTLELRERADTDDRVVLVSHGAFLDALVKAIFNQIPTHPNQVFYAHYNTGLTRIDFSDDSGWDSDNLRLHYLNRVDHLPPEARTW
jgi:2,3-bisphosphoglycerate-dependent phosphoglycerate mutase